MLLSALYQKGKAKTREFKTLAQGHTGGQCPGNSLTGHLEGDENTVLCSKGSHILPMTMKQTIMNSKIQPRRPCRNSLKPGWLSQAASVPQ